MSIDIVYEKAKYVPFDAVPYKHPFLYENKLYIRCSLTCDEDAAFGIDDCDIAYFSEGSLVELVDIEIKIKQK